jgi:anthraniloyl-CoA monooxygenase
LPSVKIACIGGGPAGLYLGILVKRTAPEHDVVVYERNRPDDTFGFGVVFSDATLGNLAAADPQTHQAITARFARWDDIEIRVGGEALRSTGHGFCGLERKVLLDILQRRARELGVRVEFEHEIRALADVRADVIVACDGVASWVRDALAGQLRPHVDVRPNKFVWLGCTVPYRAFTFLFTPTPHGLYRVHAYPFRDDTSTFIVECTAATWHAAGLDRAGEDDTLAILARVFERELAGQRLIKNRSIWRSFPTVRCGTWHADNVVLLGDAAHTAHFSIGSGTKLAMEDAIALRDELLAASGANLPAALAAYEARRRPEVEALQAAAQASLEWFEGTERYLAMTPLQLTYSLMTRSLRVSHASVNRRDPHLARGVERLLAASVGVTVDPPPPPTALPVQLGDRRAAHRVAVAPVLDIGTASPDDTLVTLGAPVAAGAALVVTPRLPAAALATDDAAVAWTRVVDYVHARHGLIAARVATAHGAPDADAALAAAIERAAFAGFDLLVLDPAGDPVAIERLPAVVEAARARWRPGAWIAAAIEDRPATRAAVLGHAAQLQRAGAQLALVSAHGDAAGARIPAAPLADRLRNELGLATAIECDALLPDLDAAVAAGRADLVVLPRMVAAHRAGPHA